MKASETNRESSMNKIEWTTRDGKHRLAAWIECKYGATWWCASVDGITEGGGGVLGPNLNLPPELLAAGAVAAIGRVALTAERYAQLQDMLAAAKAAHAATPEGLAARRSSLTNAVAIKLSMADDARELAFSEDIGGIPGYSNPGLNAARQARADFDAKHPEVAAGIAAAKSDAARRALQMAD
jgi:hypothetical protein